jgi:ABC-type Fe3+ transport system permease subunit
VTLLDASEWRVIVFTLATCALSTLLILPFGLVLAWLLARKRWRGKTVVETLLTLPLVIPPVATGLLLLKLFGRRGPIGAFLFQTFHLDIVFTWRAVVIAAAVMSFPLLVRAARAVCEFFSRLRCLWPRARLALESSWRLLVPSVSSAPLFSWPEISPAGQLPFPSKSTKRCSSARTQPLTGSSWSV